MILDSATRGKVESLVRNFVPGDVTDLCATLKKLPPDEGANDFYESLHKISQAAMANGMNNEVLTMLGFCARGGFRSGEIKDEITKNFYEPFKSKYRDNYVKNVSLFSGYPHIKRKDFPAFEELSYHFLPYGARIDPDASQFAMLNTRTDIFSPLLLMTLRLPPAIKTLNQKGKVILLNDVFDVSFISWALDDVYTDKLLTMRIPLFIYFKNFSKFVEYLQIFDFEKCLSTERLLFIFGRDELMQMIVDSAVIPPAFHISAPDADETDIGGLIEIAANNKIKNTLYYRNVVKEHYKTLTPSDIAGKIAAQSARIAFITTRFSTALQYFARDCVAALKNLGYDARIIIEDSDIAYSHEDIFLKCFATFKPEIAFCIDNKREIANAPSQAVFVCWIQDFLPHLFSRKSAAQEGPLDFVMNLMYSSSELQDLGYPADRMIDAPSTVNPDLYKHHELSVQELADYSADVCYISNSGDVDHALRQLMTFFKGEKHEKFIEKNFKTLADKIFGDIYHEKENYYDSALVRGLLLMELEKFSVKLNSEILNCITHSFKYELIGNIMKVVPLLWLHEKGYKMKLWGRPWSAHPILGKYAMGVAPNGEALSKILNASKISIGQNNGGTLHPRLMEAELSGSLYIGNHIPAPFDSVNAEKFLVEGEDYLRFYGREDLYAKIDRYLEDENGRMRIVANGRKKILESLTCDRLMKNVLDFIEKKLK